MTRDEAIKLAANQLMSGEDAMAKWIDTFSALGMLKLEEPKSALDKFKDAIRTLPAMQRDVSSIAHVVEVAGLKIVEK